MLVVELWLVMLKGKRSKDVTAITQLQLAWSTLFYLQLEKDRQNEIYILTLHIVEVEGVMMKIQTSTPSYQAKHVDID